MSAVDQVFAEREPWPPVFEFHATTGDVFKIYADGRHEGFGTGYAVNRIPEALARVEHKGEIS